MIARLKSRFEAGSFLRQAAVLTGGTLLGRAIVVGAMPILTRIYAPEDFSVLASYSAILGILAVISCLRLEIAIPMPVRDDEAAALLILALAGTVLIALIALAVVLLALDPMMAALPAITTPLVLWLVPLGVLLVGSYQALQYWATRHQQFSDVARTRVGQAAIGVGTMLGLGLGGIGAVGLTLGHMLMGGAGAIGLAWRAWRRNPDMLRGVSFSTARDALIAYRRFPIWSMPEALANVAGLQVPILIIAAVAPAGEAGHLMLAMQVMVLPMALVGTSIGQVYLSRAPEEHRAGRLGPFTLSIIKRLALVGSLPIAAIGLSAPWTFPLVFGAEWGRSGEIAAMMVPWIVLQFVASPVSMVMYVVGKQPLMLLLSAFGMVIRMSAVYVAIIFNFSTTVFFVGTSALFYLACCGIFLIAPSHSKR